MKLQSDSSPGNDRAMSQQAKPPLRVANCSGFYGDRLSAAKEMVDGGPIDVLTGDWLAELTMLILARSRKGRVGGYARTFVTQMEQIMTACLAKGIKVVTNAGGLDPQACAEAVADVATKLGLTPNIAYVTGDDLLPRWNDLRADGHSFTNFDTGSELGDRTPMTANAYLGGWGIAEALRQGADIVIAGRVTDAAVVVGPAAWYHEWQRDDWDQLAGAVVAGHIIECGCQATGGNYCFFQEVPGLERPGFPIAEIAADGSCVITKHEGTGGLVSVGTVTAQLLYEIQGVRYINPDVVTRFDTISVTQQGPDRVLVSGTRGEPAPPTSKVCINLDGGYRNTMSFCLTGLDIEAKAELVERTFWGNQNGGRESFAQATTRLIRSDKADPTTNEEGVATLSFTVKDPDERKVGRAFANVGVEMALSSYPGMFGTGAPSAAQSYGVYWPALVPSHLCPSVVHLKNSRTTVEATGTSYPAVTIEQPVDVLVSAPMNTQSIKSHSDSIAIADFNTADTTRAPLGRLMGARSGDKGGNANIGVWVKTEEEYTWLARFLTPEKIQELLPETQPLMIKRSELPNLHALNFVIVGLLEEGVAASTRMDAQAKGLGEYLRAKMVDLPHFGSAPQ
jgi:Acyclic terpene utilisation family protein AtuA